jgi:tetratricopeptide (TPR) repeat protein
MNAAPAQLHEAVRLMRGGEWAAALRHVDAALLSRPAEPRYLICRAQCLMALRRKSDALSAAEAAEQHASADAVVRDAAATLYTHANDHARALQSYDAALAWDPNNAQYYYNRASVRRFVGDLEGAEQDYDRAIALRPSDYEAYKHRSDLRTQTTQRNHVAQLRALLALPAGAESTAVTPIAGPPVAAPSSLDWRGEVQLRYALAKEYEDLGEYSQSFDMLEAAARQQRRHMRYDLATDLATVQWIIDAYPSGPQAPMSQTGEAHAGPEARPSAEAPIFVLGLPRSGTTLVERILSSHSELAAAGELHCFALAMAAAVRHQADRVQPRSERLSRREMVALSARADFAAMGHDYLRRARLEADVSGRFIDKMPLNYLYCGLIRRALPNAKIVHLTRHPMAVCYAMYKALFRDAYPFSYDLDEIARYYLGYRRLMAHWEASMPGVIYTLSYEALIADQPGETRKLLEFCGLEWQEDCLRFHENPAASATASAAQVRRPLYASSVAQWRHYEAQLAPLRAQLAAAGVAL